uniref:Peptide synthetase n=1 Tax=Rheinheimera sp. BAL341 TaxID=1708203 RepID=A0A486XNV3_9GAMM
MMEQSNEGFTLSPQQKLQWRLQERNPDASCFILSEFISIKEIDIQCFLQAIKLIIAKYEIFRIRLEKVPELEFPFQIIDSKIHCEVNYLDWRTLSEVEFEQKIQQQIIGLTELSAVYCIEDPRGRCHLVVKVSSLLMDAASHTLLVEEIVSCYTDLKEELSDEDDEPVQYIDVAQFYNELLASDIEGYKYWKKTLANTQHFTSLHCQKLVCEQSRFSSDFIKLSLPTTLNQTLISKELNIEKLLFGCWGDLISRLSSQDDISVGIWLSGRHDEELSAVLGVMPKCVPVRFNRAEERQLQDLMKDIESQVASHLEWFECFANENPTENSDFQFAYNELRGSEFFEGRALLNRGAICKILLQCVRLEDSFQFYFNFDTSAFTKADIQVISQQYRSVLATCLSASSVHLCDFSLIESGVYKAPIAEDLSPTAFNYETIVEMFEAQVASTPDNVAVCFEDISLTYKELLQKVTHYAAVLQSEGFNKGNVGIYLERSHQSIIAMLAVLKSGASFINLSLSEPLTRTRTLINEGELSVLLTQQSAYSALNVNVPALLIDKLSDKDVVFNESATFLTRQSMAYVLFTSGSTGKPKGVMVRHESLLNLASSLPDIWGGELAYRKIAINAPFSFDSSIKQWLGLLYGHSLHVIPEYTRHDIHGICQFVNKHKIDILDCTPTLLRRILSEYPLSTLPDCLLIGGESIDEGLWKQLSQAENKRSVNLYGPTECCVDTTFQVISESPSRISIGKTLNNIRVHVLDKNLKPLPTGCVGELYVEGKCLASGYLGQNELTRERFISVKLYADFPPVTLYKTGDSVCSLADSRLVYIGRTDRQVKLKGYRIELDEIQQALLALDCVKDAAVTLEVTESGDEQIIAYYVKGKQPEESTYEASIKQLLSDVLPYYMLPCKFYSLKSIPFTYNGKCDYKALMSIPNLPKESEGEGVSAFSPVGSIENKLADIWKSVLNLQEIGRNDNFFDLGGYSMLMVKLVDIINSSFEKNIGITDLYQNPTISALAPKLSMLTAQNAEKVDANVLDRAERQKRARNSKRRENRRVV